MCLLLNSNFNNGKDIFHIGILNIANQAFTSQSEFARNGLGLGILNRKEHQGSDSGQYLSKGITSIGPSLRLGYQFQKKRFVFDFGTGGFVYAYYFQDSQNNTQAAQFWLNASIGYRLNKE